MSTTEVRDGAEVTVTNLDSAAPAAESKETKAIVINVSPEFHARLRSFRVASGVAVASWVRDLMESNIEAAELASRENARSKADDLRAQLAALEASIADDEADEAPVEGTTPAE